MKRSLIVPQRTFVLAAVLLILAPSVAAQTPTHGRAGDVRVWIETDRPSYPVGDRINVRLTLRNVSSHPIRFVYNPPRYQVLLLVFDTTGREVKPGPPRGAQRMAGSTHMDALKAGEERTLRWHEGEWMALEDWEYDLRAPGRYTIVGIPAVQSTEVAADLKTVRSNEVTITIEP